MIILQKLLQESWRIEMMNLFIQEILNKKTQKNAEVAQEISKNNIINCHKYYIIIIISQFV